MSALFQQQKKMNYNSEACEKTILSFWKSRDKLRSVASILHYRHIFGFIH